MTNLSTIHISRRQLLLGTGATALLSSAFMLYRQLGEYPEETIDLYSLSNKESAIYRYIGKWLLPPGGGMPGHGGDDITIARIDRILLQVPPGKRWMLNALPVVFEHGTAFSHFGAKRLTNLSTETGYPYLEGWANSDMVVKSQLWSALKAMYGFSYFERDDVLEAMQTSSHCPVFS